MDQNTDSAKQPKPNQKTKPKADDLINRKQNSPFLQDMKNKE